MWVVTWLLLYVLCSVVSIRSSRSNSVDSDLSIPTLTRNRRLYPGEMSTPRALPARGFPDMSLYSGQERENSEYIKNPDGTPIPGRSQLDSAYPGNRRNFQTSPLELLEPFVRLSGDEDHYLSDSMSDMEYYGSDDDNREENGIVTYDAGRHPTGSGRFNAAGQRRRLGQFPRLEDIDEQLDREIDEIAAQQSSRSNVNPFPTNQFRSRPIG